MKISRLDIRLQARQQEGRNAPVVNKQLDVNIGCLCGGKQKSYLTPVLMKNKRYPPTGVYIYIHVLYIDGLMLRVCVTRFNEYLCCCVPSVRRSSTSQGRFPRTRGEASTFYETSFNSTFRRHTQELNSTTLLNYTNDTKPPTVETHCLRQ